MQDYEMLGAGDPASARKHDFNDVEANSGYAASGKLHSRELHPRERNSARGAAQRPPKTRPKSPAHNQAAPQKVLRSFDTWAFKREQPDDPQLMLQVIADAIGRRAPVPFVLYWGKGPRCGLAEPDIECLDFLTAFAARVREAHAPGATLRLIFTDTHAELNGHPRETIRRYFDEIEGAARQRGFETCWLGELTQAAGAVPANELHDEVVPADTLRKLCASARKWYRGNGTAEQGALNYYQINMVEKRAVELAFPRSIFITFNGSAFRSLFPKRLPIFYMHSLRRGVSVKPWFLPAHATPCEASSCRCGAVRH